MSVIVKGMDMPTECRECLFNNFGAMSGETYCGVNGVTLAKQFETINFDGRPDWCPLIALPDKHGRLVDADALIEFIDNRYDVTWKDDYEGGIKDACTDILEKIDTMPTIVESEDET